MPSCNECGANVWRLDMRGSLCLACAERANVRAQIETDARKNEAESVIGMLAAMPITTEMADSLPISRRLGVASGVCVFGMNIVKDVLIGGRDIFGGRSETYQKAMKDARLQAIADMKAEAFELGADAVVAVSISYQNISLTTGSMVVATATGTAVTLSNA